MRLWKLIRSIWVKELEWNWEQSLNLVIKSTFNFTFIFEFYFICFYSIQTPYVKQVYIRCYIFVAGNNFSIPQINGTHLLS